jgi:hypothetical protein
MILNTLNSEDVFSEAIKFIENPPQGIFLPEWKAFSEMIGGMREKEFTIFCGATGAGKTQWLANLATQLAGQNQKTFIASVETGSTDFAVRILSVAAGFDFNTGSKPTHPALRSLSDKLGTDGASFKENLIFSKHENRVEVSEMIETLQYMHDVRGVSFAILDNINFFLKPTSANNAMIEMDSAIHEFVMLAKQVPIHIVLVMHPRKTEFGKVKSEFDIKGSSTAVQEATNVLLMNRMDENEPGFKNTVREFVFVKIRKRGFNVGRKFYMEYVQGKYLEGNSGMPKADALTSDFCLYCEFRNPHKLIRRSQIDKLFPNLENPDRFKKVYDDFVIEHSKRKVRKMHLEKDDMGWFKLCAVCFKKKIELDKLDLADI